jgi:hypothetical protein
MDQAAKLLFGIMSCGDDRNIDETWIAGQRAYQKPESAAAGVPAPIDLNGLGGKPTEPKKKATAGSR